MKDKSVLSYQVEGFDLTKVLLLLSSVVFVGLVVLYISVLGVDKREDTYIDLQPEIQTPRMKSGHAYFELGESAINSEVSALHLSLNTEDAVVNGADAVVRYDPEVVAVDRVIYDGVFDEVRVDDHQEGMLRISGFNREMVKTFHGKGVIATIFYQKKSEALAVFNFICADGTKDDSNISSYGDDLINCGKNVNYHEEVKPDQPTMLVAHDVYFQETWRLDSSMAVAGNWAVGYATAGCTYTTPARPVNLQATTGLGSGEVHLTWSKVSGATHYTVTYGEQWLDFDFGSSNIGDTDQYQVTGLKPGVRYYFVVTAVNHCASSGYSDGTQAVAGGVIVKTTYDTNNKDLNSGGGDDKYDWNYEATTDNKGAETIDAFEASGSALEESDLSVTPLPVVKTDDSDDESIVYKEPDDNSPSFVQKLMSYISWFGLGLLLLVAALIWWLMNRRKSIDDNDPGYTRRVFPEDGTDGVNQANHEDTEIIEERVRNFSPNEADGPIPDVDSRYSNQAITPAESGSQISASDKNPEKVEFPKGF